MRQSGIDAAVLDQLAGLVGGHADCHSFSVIDQKRV